MAAKKTTSKSTALTKALPISPQIIERRIFLIRGHKVMLDSDLAELYEVETKTLNRAVRRNLDRFPDDFMFQLTTEETKNLMSQIGTSSSGYGGRRKPALVFTEHGVAMLSSVLRSDRAILVNIAIMRAFGRLRELLSTHVDLARKLEDLERKYDGQFKIVFQAIKELMGPPPGVPKRKIGFNSENQK